VADEMKKISGKNLGVMIAIGILLSNLVIFYSSENVSADDPYTGEDLARAMLDIRYQSNLVWSTYTDIDTTGEHRQGNVITSLGVLQPTNGVNFTMLSTGIAGFVPVTTDENGDGVPENPGDERGTWFKWQSAYPRDEVILTMKLQVPPLMTYLTYDVQFLSAEYPEYVGTTFNDELTITINSPSQGISTYTQDINSGIFRLEANELTGSGFNVFATSGNPGDLDIVTTTIGPGGDAGATLRFPAEHPVLGPEDVTVTINIKDVGDNMVDSAVFIDNVSFAEEAQVSITARKDVYNLEGELIEYAECGDTIEYRIDIINGGEITQHGNEFEDMLSDDVTFAGNLTWEYGTAAYIPDEHKVIWTGDIPADNYHRLKFQVTINDSLENGIIISNNGTVGWDSDNNGINDAIALTGFANVTVIAYEPPSSVTEDFSDDIAGEEANQSHDGRAWFETSSGVLGSVFEVVSGYHYSTANAFKTKLRSSGSPQYWNYSLDALECDIDWWEVWFACGNTSEASNLYLDFKNNNGENIARIKFEYAYDNGADPPMDWLLDIYCWNSATEQWGLLYLDLSGWYRLRIGRSDPSHINYSLYQADGNQVGLKIYEQTNPSFSNLERIEWYNTKNPVICPMFFWDEHTVGLT